ncbi:MAG TPA: VWA domain-containing protein [Vicinamibacterales bacterium]
MVRPLLCTVAVAIACLTPGARAQQPQSEQQQPPPPQQQPPVFRAGVKLVRVDVSVTGRGDQPVTDLQAADFEVTEDGATQRVETMKFVLANGQPAPGDDRSLEIRSPENAEAEAARDDVRLFAIFLDDYHIDRLPSITIPLRRGLSTFINRLEPTDLVSISDPLTPLSAIRLTRSKPDLLDVIHRFEGRQGQIFPVRSVVEEAQLQEGRDIARIRAEVTISALEALVTWLGGLREGRKTVIFVSQGPQHRFESADLQQDLQAVITAANRGNVTIDSVDPRGLGGGGFGSTDTLYQFADNTGGRAIINSNAIEEGLAKAVIDATAYYLIGYTPTRSQDDGKFHKISVKVKRPGVHVLHRAGYWAPSRAELDAAAAIANQPKVPGVTGAMQTLARVQPRGPVRTWIGLSRRADGQTTATLTIEPASAQAQKQIAKVDVEVVRDHAAAEPARTLTMPGPAGTTHSREDFALAPGEVTFRFTARDADGAALDRWEQAVTLPDYSKPTVSLATPRFYTVRSANEYRTLQATPDPLPRASRLFHQSERVFVDVECYNVRKDTTPELSGQLLSGDGKELAPLALPEASAGKLRFELPTRNLGRGTYILRIRAKVANAETEQLVAFQVTQ